MAQKLSEDRCAYIFKRGRMEGKQCPKRATEYNDFCLSHSGGSLKLDVAKRIDEQDDDPNSRKIRRSLPPAVNKKSARLSEKTTKAKKAALETLGPQGVDTVQLLESGMIDVEDLTWDELIGGFVYVRDPVTKEILDIRKPKAIPRAFYLQVTRALIAQSDQLFRDQFTPAMNALSKLITDSRTPARERLAASQYVIDRVVGKIPEKREVDLHVPQFQRLVESSQLIVDIGDELQGEILDVDIEEIEEG